MMLKLGLCVITCLDHRVGPAAFLGMELGDVVLVRNVSGRVTDELVSPGVSGFRARSANWPANATSRIHRTGNLAPEPTDQPRGGSAPAGISAPGPATLHRLPKNSGQRPLAQL